MPNGADVVIRYKFLPTEDSIRESAKKVVNQINKTSGKPISAAAGKRLTSEFDKTTNKIIDFLRATQQKTSLQTKIMSAMKFFGLRGGGTGGGGGESAISPVGVSEGGVAGGGAAGGGMMTALGAIIGILAVIAIAITLISAFFDAVGPIIKVVVKMISAMILILLMPFLKRGLPLLFGILKWMIKMSKGISTFVDNFFTYVEGVLGRALAGDPTAIIELLFGPGFMFGLFVAKKIVELLQAVDWNAIIKSIGPLIETAFATISELINNLGTAVFGEEMWGTIKSVVATIAGIFEPGGVWKTIENTINWLGENIFGKDLWEEFKTVIGDSIDSVVKKFNELAIQLEQTLDKLVEIYNSTLGLIFGVIYPPGPKVNWSTAGVTTPEEMLASANAMLGAISGRGGEKTYSTSGGFGDPLGLFGDFISRPGAGVQAFSPDDTIIGVKDAGKLGGAKIVNNLYVSAGVDKNAFRKLLSEFSRQQARDMRTRTSYYGG